MKKVISFSLYGNNPKYLNGALRNCDHWKQLLPAWEIWFYVGRSISKKFIHSLTEKGAICHQMPFAENPSAMLWRWHPFLETDVELVLVRDCDSLPSEREVLSVKDWLNSGCSLHIMRDHPWHNEYIMGGMWGARSHAIAPLLKFLTANDFYMSINSAKYGFDQKVLSLKIYPALRRSALVHDSFTLLTKNPRLFPIPRDGLTFIGEVLDADGMPNTKHRSVLHKYESSPILRALLLARSLGKRYCDSVCKLLGDVAASLATRKGGLSLRKCEKPRNSQKFRNQTSE